MLTIWTQAYNSEKYIRQCIESVLKQSYTDFEYVIVDDGSTDGTWDIIQEYASRDPRIRAIHEKNKSGGVRYNLLLNTAKGEYFTALDSDDWLEPEFLLDLIRFCENDNLDMCVCGSRYFLESSERSGVLRNPTKKLSFGIEDTPQYFSAIHQFLRPIWGKLIRTEILRNADLSLFETFIERQYKGFDTAFTVAVFESCKRIGMWDKCLHNYRIRDNSSFSEFSTTRYDAYEQLYEQTIRLLSKFGTISSNNQRFVSGVFFNAIKDTLEICINSHLPDSEKVTYISNILGKPRLLELRKNDSAGEGLKLLMPHVAWLLIKINSMKIQMGEFKNLMMFLQPRLFEPFKENDLDSLLRDY